MARQKQEAGRGGQLNDILASQSSGQAQGHPDADEMVRAVGASIRAARKRRRLTLQELAERTGVSISMLSMLERGVASPSIGTLVSVSSPPSPPRPFAGSPSRSRSRPRRA
jgi:ribosome-binding protein aMBF1 (putative translation factor)